MKDMRVLKVFASYLILIALAIAVLDFFLTPRIRDMMTAAVEDEMMGIAGAIALMPADARADKAPEIARELKVRVTLIDPSGSVLSDSGGDVKKMDNHLDRPEVEQARKEGKGKATRFSTTLQENELYVALPVRENGEIRGYVRLARPLETVRKSLDHLDRALYLTLYIIAIPSLLLAYVFARQIGTRLPK